MSSYSEKDMKKELDSLKRDIVVALQEERWAEALAGLESWCEFAPDHARSWLNRGYCLYHLGRLNEAVASFDRCLKIDPSSTKAASWRRRALSDLDRAYAGSDVSLAPAERTASPQPAVSTAAPSATTKSATFPSHGALATPGGGSAWQPGTVVEGRYEVQEVSRGGMAVVAIAFDRELRRTVAVKTPLPSVLASPDGRARFQREAESWIALGVHPNICCAYYLQQIGGMPRLFIEYVEGGDLNDWLKQEVRPDLEQRLDVAIQIASGIDYTHSFLWTDDEGVEHQGVIHRDIKPANVLMTTDGVARVTDFGLVRSEAIEDATEADVRARIVAELPNVKTRDQSFASGSWQTVTIEDGFVGTPPYMAPELWRQALRGTVGTDIYAYGCMLYEIFLGRRPFSLADVDLESSNRESHLSTLMRMHLEDAPPDPLDLDSSIDPRLAVLIRSCVAKDADRRPQSFALLRGWLVELYRSLTGNSYPRPEPQRTQLLADSLNNRGVSYVTLGVADRAGASFREALEVDPRHLEATFNNGLLEWRNEGLTDAELERRLTEAERSVGLGSRAALMRARMRLLLDDPNGAIDSLGFLPPAGRASLGARREMGFALLARTRASSDQEGLEEARHILASVLEESPSDISAVIGFAEVCSLLGDDETAREALTAARSLDSDLPKNLADAAGSHLPGHRIDRIMTHQALATSVLALPDGWTVVRTADGVAVVWEPDGYQPFQRIDLRGTARQGRSLVVIDDVLVACLENAPLTLFELGDGRRLRSLRTHPGVATCIDVSPNGRLVASGGSDRSLRLWNLETGECESTLQGHKAFISGVAWHPTEPWVVTASADGTLMIWDADRGSRVQVLKGHRGPVRDLVLDGDRNLAFSAGDDGTVGVWDVVSGENVRFLRGHHDAVTAVAVIGDAVAAGGNDHTVRLWNIEGGEALRVIRLPMPIHELSTTDDNQHLLAAFGSSVCRLVLPKPLEEKLPLVLSETVVSGELVGREATFRKHLDAARRHIEAGRMEEAIAPLREARAVEGYDLHREVVELWSKVLAFFPKLVSRSVVELRRFGSVYDRFSACLFTPDGASGVAGGSDGSLRRFACATGEEESVVAAHDQAVAAVACSDCGRWLASGGRDGAVRVWDAASGDRLHNFEGHEGAVLAVVFAHDDQAVISAGDDGTVRRWPLDTKVLPEQLSRSEEAVLALAVSADQHFVVSGGWDSVVTVSSLLRREELSRLEGHEGPVYSVAISPDCRAVASGGEDGTIRIWDFESGRCWRVLSGHRDAVMAVAFTPDARFIFSAGKDASLRLWNLRTGTAERVIEGHAGPVNDVAVSRDGGTAISAGADGTLRLWFLDWEPELPEGGSWDDRVRPFLQVFLRRRELVTPGSRVAAWSDDHLRELLDDLARRGFGWLEPEHIEQELEELARHRGERRTKERESTQKLARKRQREALVAPAKRLLESVASKINLKTVGYLAAVILGVVIVASLLTPGASQAEFHRQLQPQVKSLVEERGFRLEQGTALAYQKHPARGSAACSENSFPVFVDIAINAEDQHSPPLHPGIPADDEDFRERYADAINCVGTFGDSSLVPQILWRANQGLHPNRLEDLASIMVRIGAAGDPRLGEFLADESEDVRHLVALTLVFGSQSDGVETLLDALEGDDPRAIEAASFVLTELICAGSIEEQPAFELVRRLAGNADPKVRLGAVRALVLFDSAGTARTLLEEAFEDQNPDVAMAAEHVRKALRSERLDNLFGRVSLTRTRN
jgi:WD40 repeat protein/serine/threonine protein kinase/cytochrome c-type biogenesis protein CcmH/NrfG